MTSARGLLCGSHLQRLRASALTIKPSKALLRAIVPHGKVDAGQQKGRLQRQYMRHHDDLRKVWPSGGLPTLGPRKIEGTMHVGGCDTA